MNSSLKNFVFKLMHRHAIVLTFFLSVAPAYSSTTKSITLLFTHDLHSHFTTTEKGGYARLATLLDQKRALLGVGKTLTVDAGDFSMGTLFHTLFTSDSSELQLMAEMKYDVITFGNHDFDFHNGGLAEALQTTIRNTHKVGSPHPPKIVASNIVFPMSDLQPAELDLQQALRSYPVHEYSIIEKNGLRIGVFGLLGHDASNDAPYSKPLHFESILSAARRVVEKLRDQVDLVVCLSHSGTNTDQHRSEDELLALKVPGIDVIVSGHTHTVLRAPIVVGKTILVSAGSYGKYLGELSLEVTAPGKVSVSSYRLEEVVPGIPENSSIVRRIRSDKAKVEKKYLSKFKLGFDQTIAETDEDIEEERLGNLITDAFRYAIKQTEGPRYEPIALAVEPVGHIRDLLRKGFLSTADVFRVLSLGLGYDKTAGYPLLAFYVTGKELKDILEVEPSIAPLKEDAQLRVSGMKFSYNPYRLPFDRVTSTSFIQDPQGHSTTGALIPEKLYRVAMNSYTAQMIEFVSRLSHGLLALTPKDKNGNVITSLEELRVNGASELKEWDALALYLKSFPDTNQNGIPDVPAQYKIHEQRIQVAPSWNPVHLILGGNGFTLKIILLFSGVLGLLLLIACTLGRRSRRKKRKPSQVSKT